MKFLYTLLLFPFLTCLQAQEFYDLETIQTIEITFAESNWDALLDAQKQGAEDYILAQSVSVNGEVFDSVGVKYKGNSTYSANQTKNPFHIELDTYKEQDYQGFTDIKLSNVAKDPSFLREVLSYQILRQYMDAPQSNYANVYVNGNLIGLYSNSESVSKKFVDDRFGSKSNTFVKCNPVEGAGPQSNDLPNLEYLGQDSTDYYPAYELKSDYGWSNLIDLCNVLENDVQAIEEHIDVDRAIWMLAFNNVLVNLDSYTGGFTQNYYLYEDDNGRFLPVVWDLNESFGKFAMTGSGNLNGTTSKQNMNIFLHENDFPLIKAILGDETYRKMYLAHCKTMVLENFDNGAYYAKGEEFMELIDEAVQQDGNKFFSYNNFLANLDSDINSGGGPGGGSTPGIARLMDGRSDYILGLSQMTATEPSIQNIGTVETPVIGEVTVVTASISDANSAILGYRSDDEDPFIKVQMYDDGAHNDGEANDGVYGTDLMVEGITTQYFIYAENSTIGKFSPVRAQYEYHTLVASTANSELGDLVINEFMASNDASYADQDEEFDDWIELYNNGSSDIDLSGYLISDDVDNDTTWMFPEGTMIAAGDYLIIWADKDDEQEGLHADFKLSASEESITLKDNTGEVVDQVSFIDQVTDVSYGRFPNGTGDFIFMPSPTPDAENNNLTGIAEEFLDSSLKIYPNPTRSTVNIETQDRGDQDLLIVNIDGRKMLENTFQSQISVDVSSWNKGIYIIKVNSTVSKFIVK